MGTVGVPQAVEHLYEALSLNPSPTKTKTKSPTKTKTKR
jgi:hypothetical protein